MELAQFIPWIPALGALLCGLCATKKPLRILAAPVAIVSLLAAFVLTVLASSRVGAGGEASAVGVVHFWNWITAGELSVGMSYLIDPLSILMLFVVTGIGTLVAVYAAGYMAGDRGYARFFAFVCLFIFAMTTLVMADNLVLLYLGWEGVGLCSYLLIGYYYHKPSAVAAGKKAFIVNRVGDLGFALGIFLILTRYQTVSLSGVLASARSTTPDTIDMVIPFLLMLGAFGKSAQIPLHVWLPDAMEGPTPVSALIHAATMVTAGVYMIVRLLPVFELSPYALPTVATVGAVTALFAATIALCQYDIKRVWAYSTISQLGYMFLGVGALSSVGAMFHLFTHAFFKALLFLTAGSVMHALAGQLDLRKMSGLLKKMPVTGWLMFVGCLALVGFPFTSGFFSKDMILAAAIEKGMGEHGSTLYLVLGVMGLATAFLTAFYTFRLWFRVFPGELKYEMGEEHHGEEGHGHDSHGHEDAKPQAASISVVHHHEPHEMSWLMNGPLVILALGAIFAGYWAEHSGWIEHHVIGAVGAAQAVPVGEVHPAPILGLSLHTFMMVLSSVIALAGIALASYFHLFNRQAARRVAGAYPGLVKLLENKWYIDEIYDAAIVRPLRALGWFFYIADRMIIDGLVALAGLLPKALGQVIAPSQSGLIQGYGLGMAAGLAIVAMFLLYAIS